MAIGRVDFAQRGSDNFDLGMLFGDLVDHCEEGAGIQFGFGGDLRTGDAEAHLQILFVADQDIDIFDNAIENGDSTVMAARDVPEFGAVVEVKRNDRAGRLGGFHAFNDQLGGAR